MLRKNVIDGNSNTKWNLLTLALVNSSNKLVLSGWKWGMPTSDLKSLEESNFDYKKN